MRNKYQEYHKKYYLEHKEQFKIYAENLRKKDRKKYNKRINKWRSNPENIKYKEIHKKDAQKYLKSFPKKAKARSIANYKIKIPKNQICEKCKINKAIEKHHPDYSKPLKVKFVCRSCHKKLDGSVN